MATTESPRGITSDRLQLTSPQPRTPITRKRRMGRDLLLCLSWANLCFLRIWSELLTYTGESAFHFRTAPQRHEYAAAVAGVLALSLVLWTILTIARTERSGKLLLALRGLSIVGLLVPINALRIVASGVSPFLYQYLRQPALGRLGSAGIALIASALVIAALLIIVRFPKRVLNAAPTVALLGIPLVPVTIGQASWRLAHPAPASPEGTAVRPFVHPAAPRVIWLVFDEWDFRLTFIDRPPSLELPMLDSLRNDAFFATRAYPPANDTTESISSLLSGIPVTRLQPISDADALLHRPNGEAVLWRSAATVFSEARKFQRNSAVVGWYLPYCRAMNGLLTSCEWWENGTLRVSTGDTLMDAARNQLQSLIETSVLSIAGQPRGTTRQAQAYRAILAQAKARAADPAVDLLFVHVPVPHAPFFYNRLTGADDRRNSYIAGYLDHLALVDGSLTSLRDALQSAGLWQTTTIVATSDHSYRAAKTLDGKSDRRVPFIVRFPGSGAAVTYETPFNTLATHDLVLSILRSEIQSPQDAAKWLRNRDKEVGPI